VKSLGDLSDAPELKPPRERRTRGLPPIVSVKTFVCLKTNIHEEHEPKTTRQGYIESDCQCRFEGRLRFFQDVPDYFALSFVKGQHEHSCSTENDTWLPLKPQDHVFITRGLLMSASPREFYNKQFVPELNRRRGSLQGGRGMEERLSRFHRLTVGDLERMAQSLGCGTTKQGVADLLATQQYLRTRAAADGISYGFKPSGVDVRHPDVHLEPAASPFLKNEDFFLFFMNNDQKALLRRYGKMVATDATHAVFSYTNIKVIVVLVTSYESVSKVTERGFPVAIAMTTSEREDIHKAIVCHLRAAAPDWKPSLLMSDMAFSAFNAWQDCFKGEVELRWLWCVFHVWQAWIKRLRTMPNSCSMDPDRWSRIKGLLIRQVKELICPTGSMTMDQFDRGCQMVSDLLWAINAKEVAECWDSYVKRKELWAHPKRREVVDALFGSRARMPMLARSNNALEAFFSVLKYHILDGKSLQTLTGFFRLWELYEARLYSNAVAAGLLEHQRPVDTKGLDLFAAEDDPECAGEISGECERASEEAEEDQMTFNFEEAHAQRELVQLGRLRLKLAADVARLGALVNDDNLTLQSAKLLDKHISNILMSLETNIPSSSLMLEATASRVEFVRQSNNYGSTTFTPSEALRESSSSAPSSTAPSSSSAPSSTAPSSSRAPSSTAPSLSSAPSSTAPSSSSAPSSTAPSSESAPAGASTRPSEGAQSLADAMDLSSLHKRKKRKVAASPQPGRPELKLNEQTFEEFVADFFSNPQMQTQVEAAKAEARTSGLPLLRAALMNNTSVRIRAIMYDIFREQFPSSLGKSELVARSLRKVIAYAPILDKADCIDVALQIADIGIVHTSDALLQVNEVVFLRANSTASTGEPCVAACHQLSGWILRETTCPQTGSKSRHLEACDGLSFDCISWGRLVEKRRDATIHL